MILYLSVVIFVCASTNLVYISYRKSSSSDVGVPLLKLLKQCYERNRIVQSDSMSTTSSNTSSRDKQVNPIDESVVAVIRKNEKFKKRKMHCSVQGLYFTRNPDRIENSCYPLEQSWECSVCKKVFPSEQVSSVEFILLFLLF